MPLRLTLFERIIFLSANQGPGPLLDLLGPLGFKAVLTALRLDLFEALAARPLTLEELARTLRAEPRGVRFLLRALEPLGYVTEDGLIRNTALTERWLLRASPTCMADLFHYFNDILQRWENLDRSIRQGHAEVLGPDWYLEHPEAWPRYHAGMRAIARLTCPELLRKVRISVGARRLLDLGGSHGLYSVRFCQAHPQLAATVMDAKEARPVAEATFAAEATGDRVGFRDGDFLVDPLGADWDVVLLLNVARLLPEGDLRSLLGRIRQALSPQGQLIVLDQLVSRQPTKLLEANTWLINLELFNTTKGDIYELGQLKEWLREAGFTATRFLRLARSGGMGVLVARV